MVSPSSFAYWLFHAITFERKFFPKIHESKSKKSLRETSGYRWLLVSTDAEAARAGTDRQTDRQTHRTTTVTLAHARGGLTRCVGYLYTLFPSTHTRRLPATLDHLTQRSRLWTNPTTNLQGTNNRLYYTRRCNGLPRVSVCHLDDIDDVTVYMYIHPLPTYHLLNLLLRSMYRVNLP